MEEGRAITSGRHLTNAVLGACILLLASAAVLAEEPRSRTHFSQGANTARDLIPVLDPAIVPPAGSEASVYLPVRFPTTPTACRTRRGGGTPLLFRK